MTTTTAPASAAIAVTEPILALAGWVGGSGCRGGLAGGPQAAQDRHQPVPGGPANQVELVVHEFQGSILRPVAARQPSIRWGRYWIFFSLRLTMRTRPSRSAAAKLAMDRLSSDQMPSAGFMSGVYAGSW